MFTLWFIVFLFADLATRSWVASRQIRHVLRHRDQVPPEFSDRIGLRSHQRAADYTLAKVRLGLVETVIEAGVLIAFTLLGGLQWLDLHWARAIDSEMWRQLALVGSVILIISLVGLPFSLWRKFRLEARFGFNRMTPRLFAVDM